jgi:hypothetical protein
MCPCNLRKCVTRSRRLVVRATDGSARPPLRRSAPQQ